MKNEVTNNESKNEEETAHILGLLLGRNFTQRLRVPKHAR